MVDTPTKISSLPAGSALTGPEVAPFVQSGATVKITANQIATFVLSPVLNSSPVFVGSLSPPVLPNGADQTANLQAAIDSYSAASGAVLQFGLGTYVFNSSIILKPNIILRGLGMDITTLKVGLDNVVLIDRWGAAGADAGVAGLEDFTAYGFADRNGFTQHANIPNISIGPFNYYWVRNVKCIYSVNMGIKGIGGVGIVENCLVNQCLRDGINLTGTTYAQISNNDMTQLGDDCISFHVPSSASGINDYSARITGNRIEKAFGIKCLGARNTVIDNNTLRFYYGYGIQAGLDNSSSEGLITKHSISVTGNTLEDGLNGTTVGAGSLNYGIYVFGSQSLGSGGTAIAQFVGQYTGSAIQTPDVFVNKAGAAQPRGPTGTVSIVANAIRQTLAGMTNFADAGFGNLWNSSGSINPAIATLIGAINGITVHDDCENIAITGNSMHGMANGIDINATFNNAKIDGNTIFRIIGNGVQLTNAGSINGSIDISNNLIDVDPYLESPQRFSPIDGSWTVTDGSGSMGILTKYNGVTITRNRFRNCIRAIKFTGGNYVAERNILEFDWSSGNRGISATSGSDAASDIFWFCNSDPTSGNFNKYDADFLLSNNVMPTAGYFFKGHFVKNTNPSIDASSMAILGWIRLTSNNSHVAGTDWAVARVSNVSPAV